MKIITKPSPKKLTAKASITVNNIFLALYNVTLNTINMSCYKPYLDPLFCHWICIDK